jgi:hypothetical protein
MARKKPHSDGSTLQSRAVSDTKKPAVARLPDKGDVVTNGLPLLGVTENLICTSR